MYKYVGYLLIFIIKCHFYSHFSKDLQCNILLTWLSDIFIYQNGYLLTGICNITLGVSQKKSYLQGWKQLSS